MGTFIGFEYSIVLPNIFKEVETIRGIELGTENNIDISAFSAGARKIADKWFPQTG